MTLQLERKSQPDETAVYGDATGVVLAAPVVDEDYWEYRVRLSETQAVVGFPKYGLVGIGFAVEDDDWNTNLPSFVSAENIYDHIRRNKGDDAIADETCIEAIRMIQAAVAEDGR